MRNTRSRATLQSRVLRTFPSAVEHPSFSRFIGGGGGGSGSGGTGDDGERQQYRRKVAAQP